MKPIRYDRYFLNKKELLAIMAKGLLVLAILARLFYDSFFALLFLWPALFLILKQDIEKKKETRLKELSGEFRDGILAVSGALSAGYSVENAFSEALKELEYLYGRERPIISEFQYIVGGIGMNQPVETLLYDFARRSDLEDVQMFAEVFAVCKRTGGNIKEVISNTAARIGEKEDIRREIDTFLSAKKLEQRIMNVVPAAILLYVKITSPGFLEGLYGNAAGISVMTICLLVYGGAYALSEKLLKIE